MNADIDVWQRFTHLIWVNFTFLGRLAVYISYDPQGI